MRTILITNRKGGSTKTAVATNLAALYAQGLRVLLIDLDPQADASAWIGVHDTGEALADALLGRASLQDAIRPSESGVDVAPGGEAIDHISERVAPDAVRRALSSLGACNYAIVVIDCPPSLTPLVLSAYRVAPDARAVVPVDGPRALAGVQRLRYAWEDAGVDTARMQVLLSRHDSRRILDRSLAEEASRKYGTAVLQSRVRDSVVVGESAGWRRPLVLHAPTHPVTEDFRRLAREVYHG